MKSKNTQPKMSYRHTTNQVAEFMLAFDPPKSPEFWIKLVKEELAETQEALDHLLKERCDLSYVLAGLINTVGPQRAAELIAANRLTDPINKALAQTAGLTPVLKAAFDRIHESNMSKLGDDGNPVRREDGKIMKGPNYKPPVLRDLVT